MIINCSRPQNLADTLLLFLLDADTEYTGIEGFLVEFKIVSAEVGEKNLKELNVEEG